MKFYDTFDTPHGLNLKEPGNSGKLSAESIKKIGDGNRGKTISPETRAKISKNSNIWNKGKTGVYSEETIELIRQAKLRQPCPSTGKRSQEICDMFSRIRKGVKPTPEAIEKRRQGQLNSEKFQKMMKDPERAAKIGAKSRGRKHTPEALKKMSDAHIGRPPMSDETKQKISEISKKRWKRDCVPVIQCDLQGNYIKEWKSATFVAKELNLRQSGISSAANGAYKSSGGFIWKLKKQ